ncbi:MAG: Uma2 family endonuclease, partial [Mycobacteriales bacterium]
VAAAAGVYRGERHLGAADVLAAIEVVSGSSGIADRRWKPDAYAEAGIGSYWRVELTPQPKISVYVLGPAGYELQAEGTAGVLLRVEVPYPVAIDPGTLTEQR